MKFKKGDLVKCVDFNLNKNLLTRDFEEVGKIESNTTTNSFYKDDDKNSRCDAIFTIKGEYDIKKHGIPIGFNENYGARVRVSILRTKLELVK